MIIEWDLVQGSDQWLLARCGVFSASNGGEILTPTGKLTTGKKVDDHVNKLVGETITGTVQSSYTNATMQRGNEIEPDARNFYEMINNVDVKQCGIVYLNEHKRASCSPDGLIMNGDVIKKGLEIKCPMIHTHVKYLIDQKLPTIYIPQVQASMYVTGAQQWDFMSFFPGMKPLILTVERDSEWIDKYEEVLNEKIALVDERVNQLTAKAA